MKTIPLYSA